MTQPLYTTEIHTTKRGVSVSRDKTIQDVGRILAGVFDSVEASRFRYIGDIDSADIEPDK